MTTFHRRSEEAFFYYYNLGPIIGKGGNGTVRSGTRITDKLPVAVKSISINLVPEWSQIEKDFFVPLEITLMQKLNKVKGCVQLLDWFQTKDYFILVLERPSFGKDLFDIISENVRLSETTSRMIFKQIVQTLIELKTINIIHGDIKEENIIIDIRSDSTKLIDYGSSSFLQEEDYTTFLGTNEYAPPEWFINKRYNGLKSSVWSLGILLYTMICGDIPFKDLSQNTDAKVNFRCVCSNECKDLISQCLSMDPNKRPSMENILDHSWIQNINKTV